ncbi:TPA: hypothetical protein ACKP7V_001051 [Stenotrophomonas maltophilia]
MELKGSMPGHFSILLSGTRKEIDRQLWALWRWKFGVPTIYFLDICSIGHIKEFLAKGKCKDEKHEKSIRQLRAIDLPQNGVSCMPALLEKASDRKSKFTPDGFVEEISRDLRAMSKFFSSASIVEPVAFAETHARELFGLDTEESVPEYLDFLTFANGLALHNRTTRKRQFKVAKALCERAAEIGVSTSHPVVITVIASVYGCEAAQEVLKFAGNEKNFNPGNALGDIQIVSRVAGELAEYVRAFAGKGGRYLDWAFMTGDSPLSDLLTYMMRKPVEVGGSIQDGERSFRITTDAVSLFPDLFGPDREPLDEDCSKELDDLLGLLGAIY